MVLVTGGAGYIGGVTVELLRECGEGVVVPDNLSRGHRAVVPADVPLFKKNEVATVAGMASTLGNAGLLFSLLVGALVLKTGYTPFFICLGLPDVISAVVLCTVVKADVGMAEAVEAFERDCNE
jgi:NAD(P)-dependent dehydrogenase (short-subunit alcohol dehydrogenase family)